MRLEDIKAGQSLASVVPGKLVRVVAAEMRGSDGLELVYRVDGAVGQRRLTRSDEDGLVLAPASLSLPKLGWQVVLGLLVVMAVVALARLWPQRDATAQGVVSNDIPVVIRTNGGMLEVARVNHRRTFDLTEVLVIAGIEVPFCKATAAYTVDTSITYRVRLAKEWNAAYRNGRLELAAPKLEPSLPVAFDTKRLMETLRKCPAMPGDTRNDLLKSISGKLAQDAWSPSYLQLARNGGARDTVREFAQKWLLTQKAFDIPTNALIVVKFADE